MKHLASSDFWAAYEELPGEVQELADRSYALLKANHRHPPLRLKRIEGLWSVRVGQHYRALGIDAPAGIQWIWIGSHAEYDKQLG